MEKSLLLFPYLRSQPTHGYPQQPLCTPITRNNEGGYEVLLVVTFFLTAVLPTKGSSEMVVRNRMLELTGKEKKDLSVTAK